MRALATFLAISWPSPFNHLNKYAWGVFFFQGCVRGVWLIGWFLWWNCWQDCCVIVWFSLEKKTKIRCIHDLIAEWGWSTFDVQTRKRSLEALNPFILLSLEQQSSVSLGHILINTSADEHFSVACDVHALLKKQCGFASSKKWHVWWVVFPRSYVIHQRVFFVSITGS